jgi:hypothetical protein
MAALRTSHSGLDLDRTDPRFECGLSHGAACCLRERPQKTSTFSRGNDRSGAAFIASQIIVWLELVNRGYYMSGNPYAGFFYIITAIHAVHVLGGVIALGAIMMRTAAQTEHGPELEYRRNLSRAVGWYWHFIGILWIVLFVMLGFWK